MTHTTTRAPRAWAARGRPARPRRGWRQGLHVLSTVLTAAVCMTGALAVVVAIATHFSPKGQYVAFGHPVMIVLSGSMTPVIRTGDLIVDDPVTAAQARHLHVGQIISVRDAPGSDVIITHRVVRILTTRGAVSYVTKGDANDAPDATPRPVSAVIGVFRSAIPGGGYVLAALHRPLVLGLLLASAALWFLAGPLYRLARRLDEPDSARPPPGAAGPGHPPP